MSSFRLIQISDTHLSRERSQFVSNYEAAASCLARKKPEMIIHTGDVAVDALTRMDDLAFGKEAMDSLDVPWRSIAGNHDVGDNPGDDGYVPKQPVTAASISSFEQAFGTSHWSFTAAGWTCIGLNAQLFLSGLEAERMQERWLDETLSLTQGKPVAIFCHKPLLRDALEEPVDLPYRYVPMRPRRTLSELMAKADVRLFACGHVHQSRDHVVDGVRHIWCPATAFTLPDSVQPRVGLKRCGFVSYTFRPGHVDVEPVFPDAMMEHPLETIKAAYA